MPDPSQQQPLVGEVIAIGDELTTGQRLDTNTQWLAQRLTEAGVDVRYHTTVADTMEANVAVFRAAAARADVAVATGGLGPTADDLTRDAIAEAAGVSLVEDPALVEHIEALFSSRGRQMPPQNRRQAQLPEGARAIDNPGGTAPGVDYTFAPSDERPGGSRVFALPGVPAEMREMWEATVGPAIASLGGPRRVVRHWLVRCFGAGESHVESLVPELIARGREPLVGITASKATITLRVTASGVDEGAAFGAMRPTLEEVRRELGELIYAEHPASVGGETVLERELHHTLLEMLDDRGLTVGVTEAMTGGLLTHWLSEGQAELRAEFADGRPLLHAGRCVPRIGSVDLESVASEAAEGGCGLAVGDLDDGVVPVAAATPTSVASKRVRLIGHPSIHRPLVAKHALNLLRLELVE